MTHEVVAGEKYISKPQKGLIQIYMKMEKERRRDRVLLYRFRLLKTEPIRTLFNMQGSLKYKHT